MHWILYDMQMKSTIHILNNVKRANEINVSPFFVVFNDDGGDDHARDAH